jgi:predicted transcriptional regulator
MIVSSYVRHHTLRPEQLSDLITAVHHALSHLGQPTQTEEVLTPAVSVRDPCTTIMAIEEKCSNGTSARDMRSIGSNT